MLKRKLSVLLVLFVLFTAYPFKVFAKRLLPRLTPQKIKSAQPRAVSSSRGVSVKVRFRPDRRAIIADFTNTEISAKINYTLTYNSNGKSEGVVGAVSSTEEGAVREVLFGTCSSGVCRYHPGITNAKFIVTTTLPSGVRIVKPFRLKV